MDTKTVVGLGVGAGLLYWLLKPKSAAAATQTGPATEPPGNALPPDVPATAMTGGAAAAGDSTSAPADSTPVTSATTVSPSAMLGRRAAAAIMGGQKRIAIAAKSVNATPNGKGSPMAKAGWLNRLKQQAAKAQTAATNCTGIPGCGLEGATHGAMAGYDGPGIVGLGTIVPSSRPRFYPQAAALGSGPATPSDCMRWDRYVRQGGATGAAGRAALRRHPECAAMRAGSPR